MGKVVMTCNHKAIIIHNIQAARKKAVDTAVGEGRVDVDDEEGKYEIRKSVPQVK